MQQLVSAVSLGVACADALCNQVEFNLLRFATQMSVCPAD